MIIRTNNIGLLIRDLYCHAPGHGIICVKAYRKASDYSIDELRGVFYVDEVTEDNAMLREWDDFIDEYHPDYTGEQYDANEFFKGCKVWGVDLDDHYNTEKTVSVYLYAEGL